ncbi:MAG: nucleotidyltransferase family protein [Nitrospirota bacterium]|nr:nucleotidyltransferase family protein [Nitrospirota bacterium]MDE3119593.1 nucleotidyltransferase family protein [Nitrospirota bacterium]MDE3226549.1 nucleotidyltransferase family protein [Nitrospirota bacterium]MDE3241658.1 nucleotidyltransferase family protein [Nitrospirota bacterium]
MTVAATLRVSQEDIVSFCRRNKIKELALFGSVLRGDVRPDSDVDVLVDFEPHAGHSLFDFVRMQEELGRLFGRKIDLVEKSGLHNPFRRYEILRTRQVIFAA